MRVVSDQCIFLVYLFIIGTGQNCMKKKLHEVTKLNEGTKLHEDKIARGHKIARRQTCKRGRNCTKSILHQGSILHELQFCTRVKNRNKNV